MAKKDGNPGSQWNGRNVSFADVQLKQDEKAAFLNWMSGVSQDFTTVLMSVIDEGYGVSIKRDFNNNCIQCSFTQQDVKHHNANLVIMSRSDDAEEAFFLNVYKVYELFPGQRLPTQGDRAFWG